MRNARGFTLIEILVVILILAVLLAVAIPLYLRSLHDSERQTCRSNMQTIASAEQAYRVRSPGHVFATDLTDLIDPSGAGSDLPSVPRCPNDSTPESLDYRVVINDNGSITIFCDGDSAGDRVAHNRVGDDPDHGYTPNWDSQ
jgi:type IV pilus assembly protein PilA